MSGNVLIGWILGTVAAAGLIGAIKNETWLSVLRRGVDPSATPTVIDPGSSGQGSAVPGSTVHSGAPGKGKTVHGSATDPNMPGGQTGPGI